MCATYRYASAQAPRSVTFAPPRLTPWALCALVGVVLFTALLANLALTFLCLDEQQRQQQHLLANSSAAAAAAAATRRPGIAPRCSAAIRASIIVSALWPPTIGLAYYTLFATTCGARLGDALMKGRRSCAALRGRLHRCFCCCCLRLRRRRRRRLCCCCCCCCANTCIDRCCARGCGFLCASAATAVICGICVCVALAVWSVAVAILCFQEEM